MKSKIMILNGCKYADKQTGELKTLLNIVFLNEEAIADNKNFFGANAVMINVDPDKFETLRSLKLQIVTAEMEYVNNTRNPLKPKTTIKSLRTNDNKIFNLA